MGEDEVKSGRKRTTSKKLMQVFRREKPSIVRIVVLGSPGVGKTALIIRCLTNQFFNHYVPGKEEAYRHTITDGTSKVQLEIMDSNGKNEASISYADAVVLVYSVTDKQSFEHVKTLISKVRTLNLNNVPIIVMANKIDKPKRRQVSKAEGEKLSAAFGIRLFERSAAIPIPRSNVRDVFTEICRIVGDCKKERRDSDPVINPLRSMTLMTINRRTSVSLDSKDFIKLVIPTS